ncbi:AhpC/TSA family protein (plasmid) [Methylocystis sp. MJC1]|jgi:peroxiredoxin|uniref:peroxiredoxin-like family protein n=1 Tax=Methylocystis sp. MJC1 TaxID=2654282 RepID=UPI0013EB6997|nr:peroxiredoxin-like family protein [Methylocystis sp. MJC1]KAF2989288.1 hypothetical protein MJC1_03606 [Methylocystis sp. MJC1]MBU6529318.1 AhpC/TSA family protein [Methylocystis sp. MJC1]UZX14178.1 AhpC/TSA family protein [Methylocystis sp. MJC1]
MSKQAANSIDPEILDSNQSLTQQIAAFTAAAEKRLPPGYIDAFRALVARLVEEGIGRSAPKVGAAFPDFELRDDAGNNVRASDHWSHRTMIIKFYRGGWCPYCNLELKALQQHHQDLAALNAEIFAVAPEKSTAQAETKQKAAAGFTFLWDRNNELARQLGISFPVDAVVKDIYGKLDLDLQEVNGVWELPVPATFVVRDGRVRYRVIDPNYLERQDPVDLIAWLRADADVGQGGMPSYV